MDIAAIIPARYGSSRFPGKPLAKIKGKPMILHTLENVTASGIFAQVAVATDDERIRKTVTDSGGKCILTPSELASGTERCAAAIEDMEADFDAVINIQGDEPFIHTSHLRKVADMLRQDAEIATLAVKITSDEVLNDPNAVKVVFGKHNKALYFSRSVIPYLRGMQAGNLVQKHNFYKHLGIYGYRTRILRNIGSLTCTVLEKAENLEQLRWMENGYSITVAVTEIDSQGIDTPEDLVKLQRILKQS